MAVEQRHASKKYLLLLFPKHILGKAARSIMGQSDQADLEFDPTAELTSE
jgi:hypothetical protein